MADQKEWRDSMWTFLQGLVWAAVGGIASAGLDAADDLKNYSIGLDWPHMQRVAAYGAVLGIVGFIRKHKALLEDPPGKVSLPVVGLPTADMVAPVAPPPPNSTVVEETTKIASSGPAEPIK